MLMYKLGVRSSRSERLEFVALALVIGLPLALYVIAGTTSLNLKGLLRSYLVKCYGDVIAIGYIPLSVDKISSTVPEIVDHTGYIVVPSYAVSKDGSYYPVLLGYTEAAYRKNTLLGGFKVGNLRPGQAVLLRGYSSFLRPNMTLTVYPAIALGNEISFNLTIIGYAEGALPLPAGPVLFLSKEDGEKLVKAFGGYTVYSFVMRKGVGESEAPRIAREVFSESGAYISFIFYSKKDLIFYPGQAVIIGSEKTLKFLSFSSWIIATIIIVIISLASIEKNLREIATLRSLGAGNKELFQYLFAYWSSRSLAGFLIALLVGTAVSWEIVITMLSHPRLRPLRLFLHFEPDPLSLALAFSMALLTSAISTLASLIALRKTNLVEATRFYGVKLYLKLERELPLNVLIAVSEVKGFPWKTVGAILILALGSTSVVVPIQISKGLSRITIPHSYDVELTVLKIPHISMPLEIVIQQLKSVKDVKDLSLWLSNLYGSVNFKVLLSNPRGILNVKAYTCIESIKGNCLNVMPPLKSGRYPEKPDEIAVSDLLTNELNLDVGDVVKIRIDTLNRVITRNVKVVGVFHWPIHPPTIIFDRRLLGNVNLNEYKTYVIFVRTIGHVYSVAKALQNIFISNAYAAASKVWNDYSATEINNIRYLMLSMLMAIFIGLSIVTLSSIVYALAEIVTRTKISAILKTIGFTSNDFTKVIAIKWSIFALLSAVLVPIISYPFYHALKDVVSSVYLFSSPFDMKLLVVPFAIVPIVVIMAKLVYKGIETVKVLKT